MQPLHLCTAHTAKCTLRCILQDIAVNHLLTLLHCSLFTVHWLCCCTLALHFLVAALCSLRTVYSRHIMGCLAKTSIWYKLCSFQSLCTMDCVPRCMMGCSAKTVLFTDAHWVWLLFWHWYLCTVVHMHSVCQAVYNGMWGCKDRYHQFMQSKPCLSPTPGSFLSQTFFWSAGSDMNSFWLASARFVFFFDLFFL